MIILFLCSRYCFSSTSGPCCCYYYYYSDYSSQFSVLLIRLVVMIFNSASLSSLCLYLSYSFSSTIVVVIPPDHP